MWDNVTTVFVSLHKTFWIKLWHKCVFFNMIPVLLIINNLLVLSRDIDFCYFWNVFRKIYLYLFAKSYSEFVITMQFICNDRKLAIGAIYFYLDFMLFILNNSLNQSFVTERDQCPRRRFDTELKECRSYSPKQITIL